MKNYDKVIAIDPDKDKSGVCVVDTHLGLASVYSMQFPKLIDYIVKEKEASDSKSEIMKVVVEAGWFNIKSNWHTSKSKGVAAKIGKDVGANHQTGRLIVEMARHNGIEVDEVHPLKKCWKGRDGKITQDEMEHLMKRNEISTHKHRMNQDERDALLLGLFHSKLL